jgi:hypothetical protein
MHSSTQELHIITKLCPAVMSPGACRTAEGRKCRLGEGGFGIVYKAVMNGVDEVAVKLVKVRVPCTMVCLSLSGLMVC